MGVGQMDIELHTGDAGILPVRDVKMIAAEFQFFQLALQLLRIHPQINQCAHEHVAADAAEKVEIKRFHMFHPVAAVCDRRIPSSNLKA